ncbi:MAG: RyR domain-containing protein [Motiliproteus sp.]
MPYFLLSKHWRRSFSGANKFFNSLAGKCFFIFLIICIFLLSGTLLATFVLEMVPGDALWWSWSHLIDPGFISEDQHPIKRRVLGSVFAVLGLAVIAGAVLSLVEEIARRSLKSVLSGRLPKNLSGHTIIFGVGGRLGSFCEYLLKINETKGEADLLLVVPLASDMSAIQNQCGPNVFATVGRMQDEGDRSKLCMKRARRLILLKEDTSDAGTMLALLNELIVDKAFLGFSGKNAPPPIDVYLEVESGSQASVMRHIINSMNIGKKNIRVHIINSTESSARLALREHPLDCKPTAADADARVTLIIDGWNGFAQALFFQALRVAYYPSRPTRIVVVDEAIPYVKNLIQQASPALLKNTDPYLQEMLEISFIESSQQLVNLDFNNNGCVTIAVCGSDNDQVIARTIAYQQQPLPGLHQVYIETPDNSGYRKTLEYLSTPGIELILVGSKSETFELAEWLDAPAKLLHLRYLEQRESRGERLESVSGGYVSKSDYDWDNLDEVRHDWNRASADHVEIKIRALADFYGLPREFRRSASGKLMMSEELSKNVMGMIDHVARTPHEFRDDVELLARIEHDRWSGERFAEGWAFGVAKDEKAKLSPYLVDYRELSEEIKRYDREAVVEVLQHFIAEGC